MKPNRLRIARRGPGFRVRAKDAWMAANGVRVEHDLADLMAVVDAARAIDVSGADDAALALEASRLRGRAARGPMAGTTPLLDAEGLALAAALYAEASRRASGLDPFDQQLLAGIAMCRGRLVEMPTGEGKTLAAVLPAFVEALAGGGVHVITANDYLAARDAAWMGPVYAALGLRAAAVVAGMDARSRRDAYAADVTYLTAREAGYDLLRDGLAYDVAELRQRPFRAAIVDEADSILIDEARVPLVVATVESGAGLDPRAARDAIAAVDEGEHFAVDAVSGKAFLTIAGRDRIATLLGLEGIHEPAEADDWARVHAALDARALLARDVDYVIRDGRAELVDEFTGRIAADRRWPYGLQAAVEAKENLEPRPEGRIRASIAVQRLIRRYPRLAGMTATAVPAASEFSEVYGLPIAVVPPRLPSARVDEPDAVFRTAEARTRALVDAVATARASGRPVLVGTGSVAASEDLAERLRARGVDCVVLNARDDGKEAALVASAGVAGAVTVSTAMAGRGTDIVLGGPDASESERERVRALGGLLVLGSGRHESRRVDDQLRGRAGRQGDPGGSRFFSSLEDDLFVRFGARELLPKDFRRAAEGGPGSEDPIQDARVVRELDRAQRIVAGRRSIQRRELLAYGRILELQRERVRALRDAALIDGALPAGLVAAAGDEPGRSRTAAILLLARLDDFFAEHLALADELREGAGLLRYGGRDPRREFVRVVADRFEEGLLAAIDAAAADVAALRTAPVPAGAADPRDGPDPDEILHRAGLSRPTGTWTYLVEEEPLAAFRIPAGGGGALAALAALLSLPALLVAWLAALAGRFAEARDRRRGVDRT